MNDVKQGILELIHESKIKKLVMGAASDHLYSEYVLNLSIKNEISTFACVVDLLKICRKMFDLKSRKAKYVYQHAPSTCEVMFTCDGHLIYTKWV